MSIVCHACGLEKTPPDGGQHCKICHHPICQKYCEQWRCSSSLDGEYPVRFWRSCLEKYAQESLRVDGLSPCATPLVSLAHSPSSYGNGFSSLGDFPADMSSQIRVDEVDSMDTGHKHPDLRFMENLKYDGNGNSFKDLDVQPSQAKANVVGSRDPMSAPAELSSTIFASEERSLMVMV